MLRCRPSPWQGRATPQPTQSCCPYHPLNSPCQWVAFVICITSDHNITPGLPAEPIHRSPTSLSLNALLRGGPRDLFPEGEPTNHRKSCQGLYFKLILHSPTAFSTGISVPVCLRSKTNSSRCGQACAPYGSLCASPSLLSRQPLARRLL